MRIYWFIAFLAPATDNLRSLVAQGDSKRGTAFTEQDL